LRRQYSSQPLLNRFVLLWAAGKLPGLLSNQEKHELVDAIVKQQQPDGGWSLPTLGSWQRSDHTPQDNASDGYATGLITLALKQASLGESKNAFLKGRSWLEQHQNAEDGSWRAYSLNKKRDLLNRCRALHDRCRNWLCRACTRVAGGRSPRLSE
jgi:hypothetical protein